MECVCYWVELLAESQTEISHSGWNTSSPQLGFNFKQISSSQYTLKCFCDASYTLKHGTEISFRLFWFSKSSIVNCHPSWLMSSLVLAKLGVSLGKKTAPRSMLYPEGLDTQLLRNDVIWFYQIANVWCDARNVSAQLWRKLGCVAFWNNNRPRLWRE